jgi:hypothetical protein
MNDAFLILSPEQANEFFDTINLNTIAVANYVVDSEVEPGKWSEFLVGYDQGRLQGLVETMNALLGTCVTTWDVLDHFRRVREEG